MNFTLIDAEQRSEAWHQARLGRLTGSVATDMLATIKNGEAAARRDLRMRLVCERITGQPQENGYINDAMQRGIDCEPRAFAAYEALTGQLARRTGFLALDRHMAGCSLDGDVDDFTGIVELKCPKSATHLRYLRGGVMPSEHLAQVTHNLWISGAQWCDFMSFDDRFPAALQLFLVRVKMDDDAIAAYEQKALTFLGEVNQEMQAVMALERGGR
jgi:hypothetical protein